MIAIISGKCVGCGLCVQDCPVQNLTVKDGQAEARGACMECGHCFAVCPFKAVEMPDYPADGVIELEDRPGTVDGDALLYLIKSRRSIRRFQPRTVGEDKWRRILEAGRFTATGANSQNVSYTIVQEELDTVKQRLWAGVKRLLTAMRQAPGGEDPLIGQIQAMYDLHEKTPANDALFFNAPALLIITSPSPLNGGLAGSNIELMAHAEGLGVLISGFIQRALSLNADLCRYLKINKDEICACLLVGYPAVDYRRTPPRKSAAVQWR